MSASHPVLKFKLRHYPAAAWLDAGLPSSYLSDRRTPGIVPRPSSREIAHVHR